MPRLNRHDPVPLYRQLGADLELRLGSEFEPGDRIPSESELAKDYDVHRLTVRQALAELSRRGLVEIAHGKGTFVSRPPVRYAVDPLSEASFTRSMQAAGHAVELRLLRTTEERDPSILRRLRTRRPATRYHQLRTVDGVPWSATSTWLSAARFPNLHRHWTGDTSLFDALESCYGIRTFRSERSFSAVPANAEDAELLDVAVGTPTLEVGGENVTEEGETVTIVLHRFRGDRVEFVVDLR
jgi:DNA-binding GntR family transcriptional regulator